MKYIAKSKTKNVNISDRSHLGDFLLYVVLVSTCLLSVYVAAGFIVDVVADTLPASAEDSIGKLFSEQYSKWASNDPLQHRLQTVVDKLGAQRPDLHRQLRVVIAPKEENNAYAIPGGVIVVNRGLLRAVRSENELAMVLGHEIGHFIDRDHLKRLGRGLLLLVIEQSILGSNDAGSEIIDNTLYSSENAFSRDQERNADIIGLELLAKAYGHVGGSVDFFRRIAAQESHGIFARFASTHPISSERVAHIESLIAERGYPVAAVIPFSCCDAK